MTAEAYPGESFGGRVTFVDPVLNADTRTIRIRTELANPLGRLKPNMYVRISVDLPTEESLTVPTSAILYTGKRAVVWIETLPNRFEQREVSVGATNDQYAEILHGLAGGELVAASGGFLIDSESKLSRGDTGESHEGHK